MEKKTDMIDPGFIIGIILKRRWLLILPFCLAMIVGTVLVVVLPRIYSASTLILVQPQKVPDEYVRAIVSADIDSRINTISQQILSRSNLERIIEEFNIFSEPGHQNIFMEDKLASMRERISIDLMREDRRAPADAFSISFKGKEPEQVMRVTNALARYFIDENLKDREEQALGTSDFLEDELNDIRVQLEQQEEALKNYRARFMGGLPEQLDTNLRILEGLQLQLNMKNESLRYAKNNLILIEKQIEAASRSDAAAEGQETGPGLVYKTEDELELEALEDRLEQLKLNYTDRHPDIIKLQKNIQELRKKIEEEAATEQITSPSGQPLPGRRTQRDVDRQQLFNEREEVKIQIFALNLEIKEAERKIVFYQKMVQDTPNREQELLSLNRDYQNIKESYDSLLARKLESDISVNMEKKQKGEQFRILDAASLPQKPSEPDMKKLFILVVGAGLGLGGGLIFLLEYMDSSFRRPEEIDTLLELPVLCTIPRLYQPGELKLQKLNNILSIFSIMVSLMLFAGFAALTFKGVDKVLEVVKQYVNI